MQSNDFHFDLPRELIALYPAPARTASRLLHVRADGGLRDKNFGDLPALLRAGDLLVVNDSRVLRARLRARKEHGGAVEILIERVLEPRLALAHVRANKPLADGCTLAVGERRLRLAGRRRGLFLLAMDDGDFETLLREHGEVPLPPYIRRPPEALDEERYQTVYAKQPGSVAAPTAGLHFDQAMLSRLRAKGVAIAALTLHVGAGTFQPLRDDNVERHRMHRERLRVDEELCAEIAACRRRRGRVVAVGTTVVRGLESAAANGAGDDTGGSARDDTDDDDKCDVHPYDGETETFIRPGFRFRATDAMITNFHLPRTTLFVLVCAFAGRERMLAAYRHAIERRYRFFSYGDATWLEKNDGEQR